MTVEQFESQLVNLHKFIQIYCDNNHDIDRLDGVLLAHYKDKNFELKYHLCKDCKHILEYSKNRLCKCKKDGKKCPKCEEACYDKSEFKFATKIIKEVAFRLKILKLKTKFVNIINKALA